jgi:peptidoglycan/LPS O-acetylase OafA/YrhL
MPVSQKIIAAPETQTHTADATVKPVPLRTDIQALRALAVLAVVIYHFWPDVLPAGFVGVDIFFVISGFLITGHLLREAQQRGRIGFARFYAKRIKRILPSAYVTALITLVCAVVLLPTNLIRGAAHDAIASVIYLQNINLAHASVDYLNDGAADSLFNHFWSLSVEEQFYILIPLLLAGFLVVLRRRQVDVSQRIRVWLLVALSILIVVSLAHSTALVSIGNAAAYFLPSTRFWELALGALLAVWGRSVRTPQASALAWCAGWVLLGWSLFFTPVSFFPGIGALPATLGCALVIYSRRALTSGFLDQFVGGRVVQGLGNISYTLYLTHWPVLSFAGFRMVERNLLVDGLLVTGSILGAVVLYRWVDRPLSRVPMSSQNIRRTLWAGLIGSLAVIAVAVIVDRAAVAHESSLERETQVLIETAGDRIGAQSLPATPDPWDTDPSEPTGQPGSSEPEPGSLSYPAFLADAPTALVPEPAQARDILPTGAEGRCKSTISADHTPVCEFGNPDASSTIALVGDSHIEHYLPAFEEIVARNHDVRIITYFHASCPFSTAVRVSDDQRGRPCQKANEQTMASLLADPAIDIVVTSNRTALPFISDPDVPKPAEGLAESWSILIEHGIPVVVLKDSPGMRPGDETTFCVINNRIAPEKCSVPLVEALPVDHQVEAADLVPEVRFVDTTPWFCAADECPAVINNVLVFRDDQHVSVHYAQSLHQHLWDAVEPALAQKHGRLES